MSEVSRRDLLDAIWEVREEVARSPRTDWAASLWDRLFHGENVDEELALSEQDEASEPPMNPDQDIPGGER